MPQTHRLNLVPVSLPEARAMVAGMDPATKAYLSADWLAQLDALTSDDPWVLGFSLELRESGQRIGNAGYKGPPAADGVVEIAYGVDPEHQGKGYATEAAAALVDYAQRAGVTVVLAHTLPAANASTRVLSKCGFLHVGSVVDPEDGLVWRWEKRLTPPESG